jgi:hypothetical protein
MQRGSIICFVVVLVVVVLVFDISQNTVVFANFVQFHYA